MDQAQTGSFIRLLRKEKMWTQEQMAEHFGVSRRTVSRWETGRNLPDLNILLEIADCFDVEVRELLQGERKDAQPRPDVAQTVRQMADYSTMEKEMLTRRMHRIFLAGLAASAVYLVLQFCGGADHFAGGLCQGMTLGAMALGVLSSGRYAARLEKFGAAKRRVLRRLAGRARTDSQ